MSDIDSLSLPRKKPRWLALSVAYRLTWLATRVVGLQDVLGAYEEVAYRTTITALMVL